jgi:hypothetical protein
MSEAPFWAKEEVLYVKLSQTDEDKENELVVGDA